MNPFTDEMTRDELINYINSLYGLDTDTAADDILLAVDELGFDALTDDALKSIAQFQHSEEERKASGIPDWAWGA